MTNREFVLWLWGFLELCAPCAVTRKMLFIIRNHMNLVLAVDGSFDELNQKIYNLVSEQLSVSSPANNTEFFELLKSLVLVRLLELQTEELESA